jgi:hypothetical protein
MLVFKKIKIAIFNPILVMNDYFEPSNIISTIELNFDRNNSRQRWLGVKEYFSQLNDDHRKKSFKDIKDIFRDSKIYPYPLDRAS